jgi:hypothetical protein
MSKGGAAKNCPAALGSEHLRQPRTLTWRDRCKAGLTRRVFVRFYYEAMREVLGPPVQRGHRCRRAWRNLDAVVLARGTGFEPSGVPETSLSALCAQFAACPVYGWAADSAACDRWQALTFVAALPRCLDVCRFGEALTLLR